MSHVALRQGHASLIQVVNEKSIQSRIKLTGEILLCTLLKDHGEHLHPTWDYGMFCLNLLEAMEQMATHSKRIERSRTVAIRLVKRRNIEKNMWRLAAF